MNLPALPLRLARAVGRHLGVVVGYAALAVALTWPVARAMRWGCWGGTWDMLNNLWFFDQVRQMVATGTWAATTDRIFFPLGYDLRVDLAHFLLPLLSVPLQKLFSLTVAYNLVLLASLAFSGWAAYVLARRFSGCEASAWAVGALWLANPIIVREVAAGSVEVACTGFFLLALVALLRLAERPTLPRAAVLVAAWLATGLANWVVAGLLGLLVLAAAPFLWRQVEATGRRRFAAYLAAAIAATTLAAWPLVGNIAVGESLTIQEDVARLGRLAPDEATAREALAESEDLFGLLTADSLDLGDLIAAQDPASAAAPLAWWLTWGLALLGLADRQRRRPWLLVVAAAFFVLALGPYLRFFNRVTFGDPGFQIPLPAWLGYRFVPGFDLFYRPYRFALVAGLALLGPAALGARWLIGQADTRRGRVGLAALVITATVGVGLTGFHGGGGAYREVVVPVDYVRDVQTTPGRALLEVPFFPLPVSEVNARAMLAQTAHRKPIFNATLLRLPGWLRLADLAAENSLIGTLLDLQLNRAGPYRVRRADAEALRSKGLELFLLRSGFADEDQAADPYRRWPAETALLLHGLFGVPRQLKIGFLFTPDAAPDAAGEDVVIDAGVHRLRFGPSPERPQIYQRPTGYAALEVGPDHRSPRQAVSVAAAAVDANAFCSWVRFHPSFGPPSGIFFEAGVDDQTEWRGGWPRVSGPGVPAGFGEWVWNCIPLGRGNFDPSTTQWLRVTTVGGGPLVVDLDDAAFVTMPDELLAAF